MNEGIVVHMLVPTNHRVVCSWTNGRKADVYLIEDECGKKVVRKRYSCRFLITMFRECLLTSYLSRHLDIVPRVLAFNPIRREIVFSYIRGERVFEWVLARYGRAGVSLADFRSYDHLETCSVVADAFERFRRSDSEEAAKLKQSLKTSYELLHKTGFTHGSADPRNVLYDGTQVFIIDFDHSRPSLEPRRIDYRSLSKWYGITMDE